MNAQLQFQLEFDFSAASNSSLPRKTDHKQTMAPAEKKWVQSPLTEELLRSFADMGLMEICDFDIKETFELNIETKLWDEFVQTNYKHWNYPEWPSDEEIDRKHKEMDHIWRKAYMCIATALQELQQQPNVSYSPKDYVGELWNIYARESSFRHESPLNYRDFMHCFDEWLRSQNNV